MNVEFKEVLSYGWAACLAFIPKIVSVYRAKINSIETKIEGMKAEQNKNTLEIKQALASLVEQSKSLQASLDRIDKKQDEHGQKIEDLRVELQKKKNIDE